MKKHFLFYWILLLFLAFVLASHAFGSSVPATIGISEGSLFVPETPATVTAETGMIWQDIQYNWQLFLQKLPMIGFALLVLIVLLARPVSEWLVRPISFVSTSQLIRLVTRRLISILFILFGFYIFLRFAGLSEFAVAVLSGTGVIGLIIGFAFKDIAENFISVILRLTQNHEVSL